MADAAPGQADLTKEVEGVRLAHLHSSRFLRLSLLQRRPKLERHRLLAHTLPVALGRFWLCNISLWGFRSRLLVGLRMI